MILTGDWVFPNEKFKINLPSDKYLINLEGPILLERKKHQAAPKAGPTLFNGQKPEIGNSDIICSLANNHIMDFGLNGLKETLQQLENNNIKYCGAGESLTEALDPIFTECDEYKIGVISVCEEQFGAASESSEGVATMSPKLYQSIKRVKSNCDFLILSFHGGLENMPLPSPYLRELFMSFIDSGCDLIHGHHSHIPQAYESYKGKWIFYGLGNFGVPYSLWSKNKMHLWSYGVKLTIQNSKLIPEILLYQVDSSNDITLIRESNQSETRTRLDYLEKLNSILANRSIYRPLWHEMALRCYYEYGAPFLYRPISRSLKSKKNLIRRLINRKPEVIGNPTDQLLIKHLFSCDSHREAMITSLSILGTEKTDLRDLHSKELLNQLINWI